MPRTASPRSRHDEKLAVYLSTAERQDLEVAIARLRSDAPGIDRGRFIRAAVAAALDALEQPAGRRALLERLRA